MGQSQSPQKFCARPSSNMFQNNLALKIKDSAFKKHLSTHAFLHSTNLQDVDSKYSKSCAIEKQLAPGSNQKNQKQGRRGKKQSQFLINYNLVEAGHGSRLSDIEENQAEYEDEELKKTSKTYGMATGKGLDKSRKISQEKICLQGSRKISVEHNFINDKENGHGYEISQNPQMKKLQIIKSQKDNKLSDYFDSNLVLFTESKRKPSSRSSNESKNRKSRHDSGIINVESHYNSNLQIESKNSTEKENQSQNSKCVKEQDKVNQVKGQNSIFSICTETIVKSRNSPEIRKVLKQDEKLDQTVVNSRRSPYKDEEKIKARHQHLYKTTHHQNEKNKGRSLEEHLYRSSRKVYASQINLDSEVSAPQSPSYSEENSEVKIGITKLMNSKSFQEDLSDRKQQKQKIRNSVFNKTKIQKLQKTMHHLELPQYGLEPCISNRLSEKCQKIKIEEKEQKSKDKNRLSLSSKVRSKIRQKLSLSKTQSQKSSKSGSEKLFQSEMNNSIQNSERSKLSVRETIKRMNQSEKNLSLKKDTQDNYFNQDISDRTLVPKVIQSEKRQEILDVKEKKNQTLGSSDYQIKSSKVENQKSPKKLIKSKSKINMESSRTSKGFLIFTQDIADKFQESEFTQIRHQMQAKQVEGIIKKNQNLTQKNVKFLNKKPLNIIKFQQTESHQLDLKKSEQLVQSTSAKSISSKNDYGTESLKCIKNQKIQQIATKDLQFIENLLKSQGKHQSNSIKQSRKIQNYDIFVEDLQRIKKIEQIEQNLIQSKFQKLKKSSSSHNKVSILDFNKQIINENITMKVEQIKKLNEVEKLTKKADPTNLIKSKSSEYLNNDYEHLSKTKFVKKVPDLAVKTSLEKDLSYDFSKELSNSDHSPERISKGLLKSIKSLKDLSTSNHEYMIEVSKIKHTKNLKASKKFEMLNLACIPESPEIRLVKSRKEEMSPCPFSESIDQKRVENTKNTNFGEPIKEKKADGRKILIF